MMAPARTGIRRKIFLPSLIIVLLLSAAASGCRQENAKPPEAQSSRRLLIGLVPEESMFKQIERYDPLIRYLSERTGFEIKLTVLPRYENILTAFTSQHMDAAFLGSMTYVLAHRRIGVQTVARPVRPDGGSTYHGLIIARRNSGIRNVRDMRDKRFAFASRDTIAGYVLPLAYFKKAGVNYKTYLKEAYFTGTHEDVIYDVLEGKADVGAAKNTEFERIAAEDPKIRTELWVLAKSPEMPENNLAVRKDLEPAVREKLSTVLLTMHEDPAGTRILREFGADRFIESRESDYRPVIEYVRESGLKIESDPESFVR